MSGVTGALRCFIVFVVLPRFKHRVHTTYNEVRLSMVCNFASAVLLLLMSLPNAATFFTASVVAGSSIMLPFGFLRGQFSKSTGAKTQGLVLSAIASMETFTRIVASLVLNTVFRYDLATRFSRPVTATHTFSLIDPASDHAVPLFLERRQAWRMLCPQHVAL